MHRNGLAWGIIRGRLSGRELRVFKVVGFMYFRCDYATPPSPLAVLFHRAFLVVSFLSPLALLPLLPPSPLPRDLPLLHNRLALSLVIQWSLAFILVLIPVLDLALLRAVRYGAAGTHVELVAFLGGERLADLAAEWTALGVLLRDVGDDVIVMKT